MQRGETLRVAAGAGIILGICNPLLTLITLTLLGVLWLLQRPAPKVLTGVAAAPPPVRWATGTLWGFIQQHVDNSQPAAKTKEVSKDKLLYHVAIGSNCNKEVLEGRRNVKPRKSLPCCIEGFQLAFKHRGLPYWEPSFATIAPADELEAEEAANGFISSAASPSKGSGDGSGEGRTLRSATKAARAAAGAAAASPTANGWTSPTAAAAANSHASGGANGRTNGTHGSSAAVNGSSGNSGGSSSGGVSGALAAPLRALWRGLAALGGLVLARSPVPVAPRQYKTPAGRPALHGVVHQISEAEMQQIVITEGGGGNDNMGYRLQEMTCTLYDGSSVQALGFSTHPCSSTCPSLVFAHPSERYLQIVRVGIAASGIAPDYQAWLQELQPYRRDTVGQLLGAYLVVAIMFGSGFILAAGLVAWRVVARRKLDGHRLHVVIQYVMAGVWWLHNHVLSYIVGLGA